MYRSQERLCRGKPLTYTSCSRSSGGNIRVDREDPPRLFPEVGFLVLPLTGVQATLTSRRFTNRELADRLISLEQQVSAITSGNERRGRYDSFSDTDKAATIERGSSLAPTLGGDDRQTFVGETSLSLPLKHAGSHIEDADPAEDPAESPTAVLRRSNQIQQYLDTVAEKDPGRWLRAVLSSYRVSLTQQEAKTLLETFFLEVHTLNPFLHPPSVWETYNLVWERLLSDPSHDAEQDFDGRMAVATLCLCLALGRCTASSRVDHRDTAHAAGWNLYCVATYLLRPLFDMAQTTSISLKSLQACALTVRRYGCPCQVLSS